MKIPDQILNILGKKSNEYHLKSFSDRVIPSSIFIHALQDPANDKNIIFFYGDGGNGKSLLLTYLKHYFCKYITNPELWNQIKDLEPKEMRDILMAMHEAESAKNKFAFERIFSEEQPYREVPNALVDFGQNNTTELEPQDPFSATCYMRKHLAGKKLKFLLFDYAYVLYLTRTDQLTENKMKEVISIGAEEILEVFKASFDIVPGFNLVMKFFQRIIADKLFMYYREKGIDKEFLEQLQNVSSNSELMACFPFLLALDLTISMEAADAPERVVLFFDTYEAFWSTRRDLSDFDYFRKDHWFRAMLNALQTCNRILTVVAGREKPRWHEAAEDPIAEDQVLRHQVGLIAIKDAQEVLDKKGVLDMGVKDAIIRYTEVEKGEVHPLYLGICADTVMDKMKKGQAVSPDEFKELVSADRLGERVLTRFLSNVDKTLLPSIVALSICRSFNFDMYHELAQSNLKLYDDLPTFELITEFSFVKKISEHTFQIHQLARTLITGREDFNKTVTIARETMEQYFRGKSEAGDYAAKAEEIYFANRLDAQRGTQEWLKTFRIALGKSDWDLCRVLCELFDELILSSELELIETLYVKGKYYSKISLLAQAEANYLQALRLINLESENAAPTMQLSLLKCDLLNSLNELLSFLSEFGKAEGYYNEALATYSELDQQFGARSEVASRKGELLVGYGYIKFRLSQHTEAQSILCDAIALCDQAILLDRENVNGYRYKSTALRRLSEINKDQDRVEEVEENLLQALECINKGLKIAPQNIGMIRNKGQALSGYGDYFSIVGRSREAKKSYFAAIDCFNEALAMTPKNEVLLFCKGDALKALSENSADENTRNETENYLQKAMYCYSEALKIAPWDAWVHCAQATALKCLGRHKANCKKTEESNELFRAALQSLDNALKISPYEAWMYSIKGECYNQLGDYAQDDTQDIQQNAEPYLRAIECYQQALQIVPASSNSLWNKGLTLAKIGGLYAETLPHDALEQYHLALDCMNRAIELQPDDKRVYISKGTALLDLIKVQTGLLSSETVLQTYEQTLTCFEAVLRMQQDNIDALDYKGYVLIEKGQFLVSISRSEEAKEVYTSAFEVLCLAARKNPANDAVRNNIIWLLHAAKRAETKDIALEKRIERFKAAHDLETERTYRVPADFGLKAGQGEDIKQFLSEICAPVEQEVSEVRVASLLFYREYKLYQHVDKSFMPPVICYYLYKPGDPRLMDWSNTQIYQLNDEGALALTTENLIDYVKFFLYFSRTQADSFIIVEKPQDLVWRPDIEQNEKNDVERHLIPVTYLGIGADGLHLLRFTVIFKNALFRTDIHIALKAMTAMNPESQENEEFACGRFVMTNEELLFTEQNLLFQPLPDIDEARRTATLQARSQVHSHNLEEEKGYRQPVDFGMEAVTGKNAERFLREIYAPDSPDASEVQAATLSFYPEYKLYQYTNKSSESPSVYYYLYKPGNPRLMNWSNEPIYHLNGMGALVLMPETLIEYAKFFFYFVRGLMGQFTIVETPADLVWLPGTKKAERAGVESQLMPVTDIGIDENQFYTLRSTVIFKNALFRTDIKIASQMLMAENPRTLEEEEFACGQMILTNEELLCEEQTLPLQPPPGSYKERKMAADHARSMVAFNNVEGEQQHRKVLDFGLESVSDAEAEEFLESIYADSIELSEVLAAELPFYQGYKLYRYTDKTTEPASVYYYLYFPGSSSILLDWTLQPLLALNAGMLELTPETVSDYVRFYNYFVRGQRGQFIIVEDVEDIVWSSEVTEEEKAEAAQHILPITYLEYKDKCYWLRCAGVIGDIIISEDLQVAKSSVSIVTPMNPIPTKIIAGMVMSSNEKILLKDIKIAQPLS